jgi:hypothetical protein
MIMKEVLFFDIADMGTVIYSNLENVYYIYRSREEKKLAALKLVNAKYVVSFNGKHKSRFGRTNYDYKMLKAALDDEEPFFQGDHEDMMDSLCGNDKYSAFFSHSLDEVYQKVFNISDGEMSKIHQRTDGVVNSVIFDAFQTFRLWEALHSGLVDEIHPYWHSLISD